MNYHAAVLNNVPAGSFKWDKFVRSSLASSIVGFMRGGNDVSLSSLKAATVVSIVFDYTAGPSCQRVVSPSAGSKGATARFEHVVVVPPHWQAGRPASPCPQRPASPPPPRQPSPPWHRAAMLSSPPHSCEPSGLLRPPIEIRRLPLLLCCSPRSSSGRQRIKGALGCNAIVQGMEELREEPVEQGDTSRSERKAIASVYSIPPQSPRGDSTVKVEYEYPYSVLAHPCQVGHNRSYDGLGASRFSRRDTPSPGWSSGQLKQASTDCNRGTVRI